MLEDVIRIYDVCVFPFEGTIALRCTYLRNGVAVSKRHSFLLYLDRIFFWNFGILVNLQLQHGSKRNASRTART